MTPPKSLHNTTERMSRRDFQREKLRALSIRDAMVVDVATPISGVMAGMAAGSGGAACVTRDGVLVGIVTERDVLMKVLGRDLDDGATIETIMTPDPQTLTVEAFLWEALAMMEQGHYRHIPVVDENGGVAGILGQQEVLEYVAEAFPQEILNLPPRPHQTMEKEEGG